MTCKEAKVVQKNHIEARYLGRQGNLCFELLLHENIINLFEFLKFRTALCFPLS